MSDISQVLEDLKAGLEDVTLEDDNGNDTGLPAYFSLEIVDGDTLCVEATDGHRFFVEVQQHD